MLEILLTNEKFKFHESSINLIEQRYEVDFKELKGNLCENFIVVEFNLRI